MRAALAPRSLLLAATALLVGGALFHGGAAGDGSLVWIGGGAVLAASAAAAAAAFRLTPRPALDRPGAAFFVLLAGFVAWNGISIWWSIAPSGSWSYFNRGVAYFALACLGAFAAAAVPRPARVAAAGLAALLALVLGWALLGKIVPALGADPRIARLRSPVGYWNELALLGDGAIVLGLWLSARRRLEGVLLLYLACVAVVLTYSRSGIALGVLVAIAWLALRPERVEGMLALGVAGAGAAVASGVAFALPGVTTAGEPHGTRVHDGALFGVALLGVGVAVAFAGRLALARRFDPERGRRIFRVGVAIGVAAVVAALAAAVADAGGPSGFARARWHDFTSPTQFSNGPVRVTGFSSAGRWQWWKEAARTFAERPAGGTGAASFQLSDKRLRRSAVTTVEPHNTALQFLSETGIVGFALWLGAAVAAALALRRRRSEDGDAVAAVGLLALGFFVHSWVDIDWSFAATQAPLFAALGMVVPVGPAPARRSSLAAAAAVLLGLGLLYSLAAPWVANRRVDAAARAFVAGDFTRSASLARSARGWNPLSVDAVEQEAAAEEGRGNLPAAYALYIKAVDLEPENGDTWFDLGAFQLRKLESPRAAFDSLNRAYTYDRYGPAGRRGGLLDLARCRAFHRGPSCRR